MILKTKSWRNGTSVSCFQKNFSRDSKKIEQPHIINSDVDNEDEEEDAVYDNLDCDILDQDTGDSLPILEEQEEIVMTMEKL